VSLPPLRALFFDAGNTLVHMDYDAIVTALARAGVVATGGDVQRAEWRARVRLDATFVAGASTEHPSTGERYVTFMLEELGIASAATRDALIAWRRAYNPPQGLWTVAAPEAEAALALARRSGLITAVISNSNGTVAEILDDLGLGRHLDFVIDSSKVGIEKPDPRIFHLALARAGVEPGQAAYLGDLYSIDVLGARAAGLHAILMDPGHCWPPRDCPTALTVLDAVRLVVDSQAT
jgi:putative hydrolase of the HAD superfamily